MYGRTFIKSIMANLALNVVKNQAAKRSWMCGDSGVILSYTPKIPPLLKLLFQHLAVNVGEEWLKQFDACPCSKRISALGIVVTCADVHLQAIALAANFPHADGTDGAKNAELGIALNAVGNPDVPLDIQTGATQAQTRIQKMKKMKASRLFNRDVIAAIRCSSTEPSVYYAKRATVNTAVVLPA